ncbi:hypothetical protein [Bifidobacterium biavatii]|uniref:Uncharacterized protein n=1 Tax=Bifidobacterium biavatii DSM 23969 TaxID=1437608 RepID=A0A086ZU51_9BIFI|nr:hypothetical protein [Bifidobacterium biavatii]KFI50051.1 hypothetical protein BBIA_2184 [Bifidobacterium biavatii DSM 23969]
MRLLKLINRDDPARPLTVKTYPDGSAELRLGDLGITDSVITLNPAEVWQVITTLDNTEAKQ